VIPCPKKDLQIGAIATLHDIYMAFVRTSMELNSYLAHLVLTFDGRKSERGRGRGMEWAGR
jgi:hypothetical protein